MPKKPTGKALEEKVKTLPKWAQTAFAALQAGKGKGADAGKIEALASQVTGLQIILQALVDGMKQAIEPPVYERLWICIPVESPKAFVRKWSEDHMRAADIRPITDLFDKGWRAALFVPIARRSAQGKGMQFYHCLMERPKRDTDTSQGS